MKKIIASGLLSVSLLFSTVTVLATPALAALRIPNPIQRSVHRQYGVMHGNVTAINGTSLTVQLANINEQPNGKTITVLTDSNTKFRRRFWGDSSVSEISVGDWVNVKGTWTDNNQTTLQATWIRDVSIQKRKGTFIGNITSMSGSTFVLASQNRGNQTVTYSSTTQIVDNANNSISSSSLKVGDRVRVKGMWDRKFSTITEVTQIKDFSVGPNASASASPSPSASATPSATPLK